MHTKTIRINFGLRLELPKTIVDEVNQLRKNKNIHKYENPIFHTIKLLASCNRTPMTNAKPIVIQII